MKTLAVLCLLATTLFAQSEKKKLTFDVVSIKPHKSSSDPTMMPFGVVGGRYNASNAHLRQLIAAAYVDSGAPLQPAVEITGLSGWAATDGFDVEARTEPGSTPTKQQTMEMLQAMLEDRFKLEIRHEPKSAPIYALVVDSGGVKLKETQTFAGPAGGPSNRLPGPGHIRANSIAMLIPVLSASAGRKVVDKTGLTGFYEIDLNFAPDPSRLPQDAEIDPNLPSLFTALREQLGLRLAPEQGQVDTFVVESVARPSEN
jgi:uncharacterized protein (TIGR03435 family)